MKRLEPCRFRNKPATKIDMEFLVRDVELYPDAYQHERAERFGCSQRGIGYALKRLKISRKKTFFHPKADEEARRLFKRKISVYELMSIPLIYIDESGFSENMPRTFGYASEGARCFGKHDWTVKQRTNAIGALNKDKLLTAALFDGGINAGVFEAWIQQGLLPVLPNGAILVMDNASFHKSERIQEAVEAAGCLLEYLPPYSPDLNPIEHKWAQAKALKRKLRCSTDELFQQPML
jgi:transposase